jgi:hypothetical protein
LGSIVALAVVAAVVLFSSKGSQPQPPPVKLPKLVATFANPAAGIVGFVPVGWNAERGPGVVRLASRDATSVVLIAAIPTHVTPAVLLARAVHSLRQTYKDPVTKFSPGNTLGSVPVRSRILYARNQRGVPIRILAVAARVKRLGYIIEAFNARTAPLRDLEESQEIISSLRLGN